MIGGIEEMADALFQRLTEYGRGGGIISVIGGILGR